MHPVVIIGGTFLLWLAARKRFGAYADLMHKNNGGSSPVAAVEGGANENSPILVSAADNLGDMMNKLWEGLKI